MRNLEQVSGISYRGIECTYFLFDLMVIKPSFQRNFGNRRGQTYIQSRCNVLLGTSCSPVAFNSPCGKLWDPGRLETWLAAPRTARRVARGETVGYRGRSSDTAGLRERGRRLRIMRGRKSKVEREEHVGA